MRHKRPSPRSSGHDRRRAQDKRKRDDRHGYIMGGCSLVGMVAIALCLAAFRSAPVDKETGCPVGHHAPQAHTIILIDETDRLNHDELNFAKSLIRTEYLWLPIGGRLTVRNIVSNPDEAKDIVVCRLDDGSDVLGVARNKKKVEQDFQHTAGARLNALYASLATAPVQEHSPIMEFIAEAADRPDFGSNVKARRLVVLSDFAQHSDLVSQYGVGRHFSLDEEARTELRRDLTGVQVRLQYIPRAKLAGLQGERHKAFWIADLKTMGANVALGHSLLVGEDPTKETWIDED